MAEQERRIGQAGLTIEVTSDERRIAFSGLMIEVYVDETPETSKVPVFMNHYARLRRGK
jgi:hypothetical protein